MQDTETIRVLLVSIVPPRNDCGVRIVMYRHLVERKPFNLRVASNADFAPDLRIDYRLTIPYLLFRLSKSRLARYFRKWIQDFENLVWSRFVDKKLQKSIDDFKPQLILTLAETSLCHMAARAARKNNLPLAGLFLDWFPIMPPHFGHKVFQPLLSRKYRTLYRQCDLAICTSDGMKKELGEHPNSHVIYPMPGNHPIVHEIVPKKNERFRVVYVGAAESFYGRMLIDLLSVLRYRNDIELLIVGPASDWPSDETTTAKEEGSYLGIMSPEKASQVIAGADALLVVMSFESDHKLFMQTSFTTKFLDYAGHGKPILLWGPAYCTPFEVAKREDGALVIESPKPNDVVDAISDLAADEDSKRRFSAAANKLHEGTFNPERLQTTLVSEINKLIHD